MTEYNEEKQGEQRKTILVVDDDRHTVRLVRINLERAGYRVVEAYDGTQVIGKVRTEEPDLVILDIMMPTMDGFSLLGILKDDAEAKRIPIMILTAKAQLGDLRRGYELGADAYLTKPFDLRVMLEHVGKLLFGSRDEVKAYQLRNLVGALIEQYEALKQEIDRPSTKEKIETTGKNTDEYRAVCGAVAHNLKGEFLHIGNSANSVRELAGTIPDVQEECEIMERSVEYSQILLRRLLDYLDIGVPQIETVDVVELVRRIELLARPRLPVSVGLNVVMAPTLKERMVSANPEQLMGVLLELIHNASNVLRETGGTIKLELDKSDRGTVIVVRDDGPGIPDAIRDKLLNEQVPSKSGLGLGLFLSRKVVGVLGGRLEMETATGKGTTFSIVLPKVKESQDADQNSRG